MTILSREIKDSLHRDLRLEFRDTIDFRSKKATGFFGGSSIESRQLVFLEDAALGKQAAVAELTEGQDSKGPIHVRVSPNLASLAPIQLSQQVPRAAWGPPKAAGGTEGAGAARGPGPGMVRRMSRGHASGGGAGGQIYGHKSNAKPGAVPASAAAPGKPPQLPPPPSAQRRSFSSFPQAQAIHAFSAAKGDQLSFNVGAVVHIVERSGDDWWMCELNGKVGLTPSNYLKML